MQMKYYLCILFTLVQVGQLSAQHPNILIHNSFSSCEPSIAIDRKDPSKMVAGIILNIACWSDDYGMTWSKKTLESTYGVYGDPAILSDTAGNFYYFHLSNPPNGNWIDRIVCQKSEDGGATWNNGSYTGLNGTKAQDKHWPVLDPLKNHLYVTWTQFDKYGSTEASDSSNIFFSKSIDGGQSWLKPVRINKRAGDCIDDDNTVEGAVPAVGPNGEIYVSWAGPDGILFEKSLDGGVTWMDDDKFVDSIQGGWAIDIPGIYRCNGMPVTLCDNSSGPYKGNIYINFADQRNGVNDTDVWMITSSDGGNTWNKPVRVNDDPPGKHQFFTWSTIDPANGYIYCVFYDRRNYNNELTDVFLAVSKDGGASFKNFKISESPFLPEKQVFFGDYNNISAQNNVIRPIWTRLENGNLSVWTALIDTNVIASATTGVQELTFTECYPNPTNKAAVVNYTLNKRGTVDIYLIDSMGKPLDHLVKKKKLDAGTYSQVVNFSKYSVASGTYTIVVMSGKKQKRIPIVYVKE